MKKTAIYIFGLCMAILVAGCPVATCHFPGLGNGVIPGDSTYNACSSYPFMEQPGVVFPLFEY